VKFSILLPTRNRLDLLKLAIGSVRMQDLDDWEIVVQDNASADDVCGYVASLADPRVRCERNAHLVPVTDNWNLALERARGDYCIMLGDDDALMLGCLSTLTELIERWDHPEAIYTQALQYAYPGVIPGHAKGFIQTAYNAFLQGADLPFLLDRATAREMVQGAMRFRLLYGFNMQYFVVSRVLIERLRPRGPFFQSPYPDYYAANAVLLAARTVLANPRPLVLIGISPKSFGYFYFNRREREGVDFLQNARAAPREPDSRLVPGTDMNDSWLDAMETLARNFPDEPDLRVDYGRYRLLQFFAILRLRSWRGLPTVLRHARLDEFALYGATLLVYAAAWLLPPAMRRAAQGKIRARFSATPPFDPRLTEVPHADILEASRALSVETKVQQA
jgi:glycosyltransferase involved in cell wall biosynthesis